MKHLLILAILTLISACATRPSPYSSCNDSWLNITQSEVDECTERINTLSRATPQQVNQYYNMESRRIDSLKEVFQPTQDMVEDIYDAPQPQMYSPPQPTYIYLELEESN